MLQVSRSPHQEQEKSSSNIKNKRTKKEKTLRSTNMKVSLMCFLNVLCLLQFFSLMHIKIEAIERGGGRPNVSDGCRVLVHAREKPLVGLNVEEQNQIMDVNT